jgi:hypothetical protein
VKYHHRQPWFQHHDTEIHPYNLLSHISNLQYWFDNTNVITPPRRQMHSQLNFHPIKLSPMHRHQKWTCRPSRNGQSPGRRSPHRAETAPHRKQVLQSSKESKSGSKGPQVLNKAQVYPSTPPPMNESHKNHHPTPRAES